MAPFAHYRVRAVREMIQTAHKPLLVLAEDGEQYYLKYTRHQSVELQCEWLCHLLLRLWDVPTPPAVVLTVPDVVRQNLPAFAQPVERYLRQPVFGSERMQGAVDSSGTLLNGAAADLTGLSNPDDLLWVALFDAWVSNDDRHTSHHNLLLVPQENIRLSRLRCFAIDHAYTFTSQPFEELRHEETYFSYNSNLSQSPIAQAVLRQWQRRWPLLWADELKRGYYLRVNKCREHFFSLCNLLPRPHQLTEPQQTKLFYFLFCPLRLERLWEELFQALPK